MGCENGSSPRYRWGCAECTAVAKTSSKALGEDKKKMMKMCECVGGGSARAHNTVGKWW